MAALRFCFSNYGKSLAGRFKAFHFGETYRDMRHIIIKKVPHRMKQFTIRGQKNAVTRAFWPQAPTHVLLTAAFAAFVLIFFGHRLTFPIDGHGGSFPFIFNLQPFIKRPQWLSDARTSFQ